MKNNINDLHIFAELWNLYIQQFNESNEGLVLSNKYHVQVIIRLLALENVMFYLNQDFGGIDNC